MKYKEPLLLFHQDGAAAAQCERASRGRSLPSRFAARGLAIGDYNNDGRMDVLVGNNGGAPLLLRNNAGAGNHWLGVKLQGVKCNRDAVGARLTWSAGGVERTRAEEQRRQLSFLARPARGAGDRRRGETRLAGDPMAAAQRARGAVHGPEGRCVRAHC